MSRTCSQPASIVLTSMTLVLLYGRRSIKFFFRILFYLIPQEKTSPNEWANSASLAYSYLRRNSFPVTFHDRQVAFSVLFLVDVLLVEITSAKLKQIFCDCEWSSYFVPFFSLLRSNEKANHINMFPCRVAVIAGASEAPGSIAGDTLTWRDEVIVRCNIFCWVTCLFRHRNQRAWEHLPAVVRIRNFVHGQRPRPFIRKQSHRSSSGAGDVPENKSRHGLPDFQSYSCQIQYSTQ